MPQCTPTQHNNKGKKEKEKEKRKRINQAWWYIPVIQHLGG
jgi:hypothetical protein